MGTGRPQAPEAPEPAPDLRRRAADEYAAAKLGSEQQLVKECPKCSEPTTYFLFKKDKSHTLIAGPEFTEKDLFIKPTGKKVPRDAGVVVKGSEQTSCCAS